MLIDKIVVFIVLVGLAASVFADDPLDQPAGKWYVVAVMNYNKTLPEPKCWTVEVSKEIDFHLFDGVSTFYSSDTSERYQFHFKSNRYGISGNSYVSNQYFNGSVTYGANQTLVIDSMSYIHIRRDEIAVLLSEIRVPEGQFNYFEMLYISRDPELPSDYNVGSAMRVNNRDCL